MPITGVLVALVGGVGMWKVHQFSEPPPVVTVNEPAAPPEFTYKYIDYQVDVSGTHEGTIVWTDYDGKPTTVDLANTTLPWIWHDKSLLTVVSGSISAQVRGGQVGCTIKVNGNVPIGGYQPPQDGHVYCLVKSA
jgi:hypothetical protein